MLVNSTVSQNVVVTLARFRSLVASKDLVIVGLLSVLTSPTTPPYFSKSSESPSVDGETGSSSGVGGSDVGHIVCRRFSEALV